MASLRIGRALAPEPPHAPRRDATARTAPPGCRRPRARSARADSRCDAGDAATRAPRRSSGATRASRTSARASRRPSTRSSGDRRHDRCCSERICAAQAAPSTSGGGATPRPTVRTRSYDPPSGSGRTDTCPRSSRSACRRPSASSSRPMRGSRKISALNAALAVAPISRSAPRVRRLRNQSPSNTSRLNPLPSPPYASKRHCASVSSSSGSTWPVTAITSGRANGATSRSSHAAGRPHRRRWRR